MNPGLRHASFMRGRLSSPSRTGRGARIYSGVSSKSAASISSKLTTMGFDVLRWSVASDEISESAFLFLVSELKIGSVFARKGPEYFREEEVENYFSKNRKKALMTWISEDGKVESTFRREFVNATDALKNMLSKRIDSAGLSDEIKREVSKGFRVSLGTLLVKRKDWLGRALLSLASEE